MTNTWFNVKVKYTKQFDDGRIGRVSEQILVDAVSFTEAEKRSFKEMLENLAGESSIEAIQKKNISDIFAYDDGDQWYSGILEFVSMDADSGREKKAKHEMYLNADNLEQAHLRLQDSVKDLAVSYQIKSIKETRVVEVFPYVPVEQD